MLKFVIGWNIMELFYFGSRSRFIYENQLQKIVDYAY